MVNRQSKLMVTAFAVAAPVALFASNVTRPARAEVAGVGQAQLYPSWTRITAKCSGKGKKIRCRIKGKVTVVNDGNAQSAPCKIDLWVSRNDTIDPKEDKKVQTLNVPAIAAESDVDLDLNFSAPKGTKVLKRYLIAVVDPDNQVAESDEEDNVEAIGPLR